MKSVFDLIDTFQSRIKDMERQKKEGIVCKEDKKQSLESFLSRYYLLLLAAASPSNYCLTKKITIQLLLQFFNRDFSMLSVLSKTEM